MISICLVATLVLGSAHPVAAEALPTQPFALWPPHFCAKSAGNGEYRAATGTTSRRLTSSMRALGSDGVCNDSSPAAAETFSAMPRLQVHFPPLGGWVMCVDEPYLRSLNVQNASIVTSAHTVYGCGAAPHRLWSGSRITYGGVNHYDNRYTGEL